MGEKTFKQARDVTQIFLTFLKFNQLCYNHGILIFFKQKNISYFFLIKLLNHII